MLLRKRVYSGLSAACASLAILASGLTGCAGGGTTAVTPNQTPNVAPQDGERMLQTIGAAPSVTSLVTGGTAYGTPLQGERARPLSVGKAIRTGGIYDLAYYGGPTLSSATSYDIYVNCAGTCWGSTSPGTSLGRLAGSTFVHVIDQYTGSTANGRYPYGGGYQVNYNTSGVTLQDQDIYNIVHAVAVSVGTGYGRMYHVFLQSGVQQCSASAGGCYAQNGGYCAYHGNVNFSDIGHTIYSVEPYQNISGCAAPSGNVIDSTLSTLSHEYFEAITDPDIPQNVAWYNNTGGEIGDICRSSYGTVNLSGFNYNSQREYSNRISACTFTQ